MKNFRRKIFTEWPGIQDYSKLKILSRRFLPYNDHTHFWRDGTVIIKYIYILYIFFI